MSQYRLKHDLHITFKRGQLSWELDLPKGLAVAKRKTGTGEPYYIVSNYPYSIFPKGSFLRHDATTYGVSVNADDVEEIKQ